MRTDARRLPDGEVRSADVCIVGAGPAGITVARDLRGSGLSVVVLESGGDTFDPATQSLYAGDVVGEPLVYAHLPMPLEATRLRYLGGSSNHWGGMCRPLEPIDLEPRPELGRPGWPIPYDELARWYPAAVRTCRLPSDSFDADEWYGRLDRTPPVRTDAVTTVMFQLSPPLRFGEAYGPELDAADDVELVLWANVVDLHTPPDGGHVTEVVARTLSGIELRVRAEVVVLATGGIEVPRLLLASTSGGPAGLGNRNDLVGRYFAEHPSISGSAVVLGWPDPELPYGAYGGEAMAALAPTTAALVDRALPGAAATIEFPADGWEEDPGRLGTAPSPADVTALYEAAASPPAAPFARLNLRAEQLPDPDSRVRLGSRTDRLGMPVAQVDWRLTEATRQGAARALRLIAAEVGQAGAGRVVLARTALDPAGTFQTGNHHMGTTRMDPDPGLGVVDTDLRVHGVDNLYVAGSAVFPTTGYANPTLTLVALAHRLAAHLRSVATRGS